MSRDVLAPDQQMALFEYIARSVGEGHARIEINAPLGIELGRPDLAPPTCHPYIAASLRDEFLKGLEEVVGKMKEPGEQAACLLNGVVAGLCTYDDLLGPHLSIEFEPFVQECERRGIAVPGAKEARDEVMTINRRYEELRHWPGPSFGGATQREIC